MEGIVDGPARATFKKLADRLTDFDQGGTITTDVYQPEAYRGVLFEAPGIEAADVRNWPWPDLTAGRLQARRRPERQPVPAPHADHRGGRAPQDHGLPGRAAERRPEGSRRQAVHVQPAAAAPGRDRVGQLRSGGSCHRVPRGLRSLRRPRLRSLRRELTRRHPPTPAGDYRASRLGDRRESAITRPARSGATTIKNGNWNSSPRPKLTGVVARPITLPR